MINLFEMEFESSKNYKSYLFGILIIIFCALLIIYFWTKGNILIYLVLFTILTLVFISKRFTYKIIIKDNDILLIYYQWLKQNKILYSLNSIDLKISKKVANRGHKYFELSIIKNDKIVHEIDERDGYDINDFESILNKVKKIK
jgi:hypothetical protein